MAEKQITNLGQSSAPLNRITKDSERFVLLAVRATFTGTGAASSFVPAVEIVSDSGEKVGTFPAAQTLAVGDSADVTFAPFLRSGVGLTGIYFDILNSGGTLYIDTTGEWRINVGTDLNIDSIGGDWNAVGSNDFNFQPANDWNLVALHDINESATNNAGLLSGRSFDRASTLTLEARQANGDASQIQLTDDIYCAPDDDMEVHLETGNTFTVTDNGGAAILTLTG